MPRYVALLRGINVGGRNLIKMPALKACFEANGFEDVATYIQSGNVVFSSTGAKAAVLTGQIEEMLAEAFGYGVTAVVRSRAQMRTVIARAPSGFGGKPSAYRYDVIFLKEPLTARTAMTSVPTNPAVDEVHGGTGVLYFSRLIEKATQSRLNRIVASPIYPNVTIRNWNTTTKLERMVSDPA
jgi:uncharacterized protein (DUF1697 family)